MITSSDFQGLVDVVANFSSEDVQIQTKTIVSDGQGGSTETWPTVTTVKGWVAPIGNSSSEQILAGRLQDANLATVTLPKDTIVNSSQRLVVGTRTFEIVGIPTKSTIQVRQKVYCKELV